VPTTGWKLTNTTRPIYFYQFNNNNNNEYIYIAQNKQSSDVKKVQGTK